MKRIKKFKEGLKQCLFSKPKGKTDSKDVFAAHAMVASQIWCFSKR